MPKFILFFITLCLIFSSCQEKPKIPLTDDGTSIHFDQQQKPFYHGVASGDPLGDAVIIWTRVTPDVLGSVSVKWKVATDEQFANPIKSGSITTDESKDFTVKIDVKGLTPGTTYYYQFEALNSTSVVGKTKTLATQDIHQAKLAIVSCSNYEAGYFNAFGRVAEKTDLDAVLHLGDYIYEYEIGGYGNPSLDRKNLPAHEIVSLQDYRTRYALYRLDKDFQKAHQMHPFITIWDDHEITNDSYKEGAENHQEEKEGDFTKRKTVARQAYYEWLPIREAEQLYRGFKLGNLIDLVMLDERLAGRSKQADSLGSTVYNDPERTMLGKTQLDWFLNQLDNSKATWRIIGNQVIFSDLTLEGIFPNRPRNLDAWDGYPFEKQKITQFLKEKAIQNTIWVTGDSHCSWAFETPTSSEDYQKEGNKSLVATEFGVTSITSSNYNEYTSMDTVKMAEGIFSKMNPHLKYVDLSNHGYLLLTVNHNEVVAEWMYVNTITEPSKTERVGKTIRVKKGEHILN